MYIILHGTLLISYSWHCTFKTAEITNVKHIVLPN